MAQNKVQVLLTKTRHGLLGFQALTVTLPNKRAGNEEDEAKFVISEPEARAIQKVNLLLTSLGAD